MIKYKTKYKLIKKMFDEIFPDHPIDSIWLFTREVRRPASDVTLIELNLIQNGNHFELSPFDFDVVAVTEDELAEYFKLIEEEGAINESNV